jgi:hypothetical protein
MTSIPIYRHIDEYTDKPPTERVDVLRGLLLNVHAASDDFEKKQNLTEEFFEYWRVEPSRYLSDMIFSELSSISQFQAFESFVKSQGDAVKPELLDWLASYHLDFFKDVKFDLENQNDAGSLFGDQEIKEIRRSAREISNAKYVTEIKKQKYKRMLDLNLGSKKERHITPAKRGQILRQVQSRYTVLLDEAITMKKALAVLGEVLGDQPILFKIGAEIRYNFVEITLESVLQSPMIGKDQEGIVESIQEIKTALQIKGFIPSKKLAEEVLDELSQRHPAETRRELWQILLPFLSKHLRLSYLIK